MLAILHSLVMFVADLFKSRYKLAGDHPAMASLRLQSVLALEIPK
jgi:hypothetical protein